MPELDAGECYFVTLRVVAEIEVLSPHPSTERKVTFSQYKTPAAMGPGVSGNGPCISVDGADRREQVSVLRHTPRDHIADDEKASKIRYNRIGYYYQFS